MNSPKLSAQGLTKSFGELHAVRGVSFDIPKGEVFGLLGPNGAGENNNHFNAHRLNCRHPEEKF